MLPTLAEKTLSILNGEKQLVSGPTGKDMWRRPSEHLVARTLELAWKKVLPDLANTAVQAEIQAEVKHEPVDNRHLARVIANVLSHAKLDDAAEQAEPPAPQPEMRLLTRSEVIEVDGRDSAPFDSAAAALDGEAGGLGSAGPPASPVANGSNGSGSHQPVAEADGEAHASTASPSASDEPEHGAKVYIADNGAYIVWDSSREKWLVKAHDDHLHQMYRDRAKAEEHAARIPGPSLMAHPGGGQPPQPQRIYDNEPRRDNQPIPTDRPPRVLSRAPR